MLYEKLEKLKTVLAGYGSTVVAFSGGCDSAFLAFMAREVLGSAHMIAATAKSESLPMSEAEDAGKFASRFEIPHIWIHTREMEDPDYAANPVNRCYFCKTELYRHLIPLRNEKRFLTISNGANTDDLGDWRPGLGAAREFKIRTPLVEAGLSKADIRELSREAGLPTWDKPAAACLSSRIPYGSAVTEEKLRSIEKGEAFLKDRGFRMVRLRHFGSHARIEIGKEEMDRLGDPCLREELLRGIRSLGFESAEFDPEGYRQGRLNTHLAEM